MKFGIISFAHMHAHSYARALAESPGLQLVGIADEVAYRGAQAADRYAGPPITTAIRSCWPLTSMR